MLVTKGRILVVNQVHPEASDTNPGTETKPFVAINAAARLAQPGDTILVHEGVYREEVAPVRGGEEDSPITYMAAPDEKVYIKGSELYQGNWEPSRIQGIYSAKIEKEMTGTYNPFSINLIDKLAEYKDKMQDVLEEHTLGQVFVDGTFLDEVEGIEDLEAMPGTWLAEDSGRSLRVHFPSGVTDPTRHMIELTTRKAVFRPVKRGMGYIIVKGFIMEHAANQAITTFWEKGSAPQQGLISCRSGHHWVIEGNTIRWAKSLGIDVGSERKVRVDLEEDPTPGYVGYHLIQNNIISDNGEGGLCGIGQIGTVIRKNVFERNNNLGSISWEDSAIKTHFFINGVIEGNLIRDNHSNGIWIDNVYQNVRITRNVILGNRGAGIFCEMGGTCLIDNNIIGHSIAGNSGIGGNGIYAHDAGGITAVHNLIIQNAKFGVCMTFATKREYNVYPQDITSFDQDPLELLPCNCSNSRLFNNIFVGNNQGAINLPYPSPIAEGNLSDSNLFCGSQGFLAFFANNKSEVSLEHILGALNKAYSDAGVPEENRSMPLQYGDGFMLTFDQWRILMDMDKNSQVADISNLSWQLLHPGQEPWVAFCGNEALEKVICKKVEGLDVDFLGSMMPEKNAVPGPFQKINKMGNYRFRIWPVRD